MTARRLAASVGLAIIMAAATTPAVFATCCSCTGSDKAKTICLTISKGSCGTINTDYATNSAISSVTCSQAVPDAQCKTVSDGGVCAQVADAAAYANTAGSAGTTGNDETLIAPDLAVKIPGLIFTTKASGVNGSYDVPFLAQYIAAASRYLIGISVIAAAVMIVYGGFLYIMASTSGSISTGKDIIQDALIGLFLVFGSYTILSTINAQVLKNQAVNFTFIKPISIEDELEAPLPPEVQGTTIAPSSGGGAPLVLPKGICKDGNDCKKYCPPPEGTSEPPPTDVPGIADPANLRSIPTGQPGLGGGGLVRTEVVPALIAAGKAANEWPGGPYTIYVGASYRPLTEQIKSACAKIKAGLGKDIGANVATPGGSLHGTGVAVDVILKDSTGKSLTSETYTVASQTTDVTKENAQLLEDIMVSAGWVRYCHETWHFEFGVPSSFPGRSKNCPWPPP